MAPHPTYHKAQTLYNNQQCPSRSDLYLLSDTLTSLKFLKLTNKTCLISSTPNTLLLVLTWVFLEHFSQFKCNCLEKILLTPPSRLFQFFSIITIPVSFSSICLYIIYLFSNNCPFPLLVYIRVKPWLFPWYLIHWIAQRRYSITTCWTNE